MRSRCCGACEVDGSVGLSGGVAQCQAAPRQSRSDGQHLMIVRSGRPGCGPVLLCGAMTSEQSPGQVEPAKAEEGWPLWGIVLLGTVLSFTVGYFLAAALARLVAGRGSWWNLSSSGDHLTSDELYDVLKSDVAAVGLMAAGGAAFLAYRRQRTSEAQQRTSEAQQQVIAAQQRTADDQHRLERQRHDLTERVDFRDRYVKAVEQLGHDKPAVRLGGVYAMAQLADDWGLIDVAQRQVCIDVLCAYFRMPYDPEKAESGEEQVRFTVISVIRQHLQDPESPTSWCRAELNFTGATFTGNEHFYSADFSGGTVSFSDANFCGRTVFFDGAKFSGGKVYFIAAKFSGGSVSFDGAKFTGGLVNFSEAEFSAGTVSLIGVEFSGSTVHFIAAKFSGGSVSFDGAKFTGGLVNFSEAEFSAGTVSLIGVEFSGGLVLFDRAEFPSGKVSFDGAKFTGGTVNFAGVRDWSHPPDGLPDSPRPGLTLPSRKRRSP